MSKSYIKLKNVGDAATFTVVRCAPGTGQYPDVEFEDSEGRVYAVPKTSADKQLDRIGFPEYGDVVGQTVMISRGENKKAPDKPFWNIDLATKVNGSSKGGASNGAATATTQPAVTAQAPAPEKITGKYEKAVEFVLSHLVPKLKAAGVTVTHEGVSSMAATVFIAANNGGRH